MSDESVRYTSRTHEQIREDLIRLIPQLAPSLTNHGEDEPFIALVDMLSGVADGLHYYLDKQALENYLPTVKLRKNALSLAHLAGYRPRRTIAPTGTISVAVAQPLPHEVFIPARTQTQTNSGLPVVLAESVYLPQGFSGSRSVTAYQGTLARATRTSDGSSDATIVLPTKNPCEQLFSVTTYGEAWIEFRDTQPEDPTGRWYHYLENTDETVRLRFLGEIGNVPMSGTPVEVEYMTTEGTNISSPTGVATPELEAPAGLSEAEQESFDQAVSFLVLTTGTLEGYKPKESVAEIRYTAPMSYHVRRRAVEEEDYIYLSRQVPGVRDVKMSLSDFYAREVVAHVLGDRIGEVSEAVLDRVEAHLNHRRDLTLNVVAQAATIEPYYCTVQVKSRSGYTDATATFAVKEALSAYLNEDAVEFGRVLRVGEIYSVANQLDEVEYVNVTALYKASEAAQVHDLEPEADVNILHVGGNLSVQPLLT